MTEPTRRQRGSLSGERRCAHELMVPFSFFILLGTLFFRSIHSRLPLNEAVALCLPRQLLIRQMRCGTPAHKQWVGHTRTRKSDRHRARASSHEILRAIKRSFRHRYSKHARLPILQQRWYCPSVVSTSGLTSLKPYSMHAQPPENNSFLELLVYKLSSLKSCIHTGRRRRRCSLFCVFNHKEAPLWRYPPSICPRICKRVHVLQAQQDHQGHEARPLRSKSPEWSRLVALERKRAQGEAGGKKVPAERLKKERSSHPCMHACLLCKYPSSSENLWQIEITAIPFQSPTAY